MSDTMLSYINRITKARRVTSLPSIPCTRPRTISGKWSGNKSPTWLSWWTRKRKRNRYFLSIAITFSLYDSRVNEGNYWDIFKHQLVVKYGRELAINFLYYLAMLSISIFSFVKCSFKKAFLAFFLHGIVLSFFRAYLWFDYTSLQTAV